MHSFAFDCYRRFIQMYSDVVCRVPRATFEHVLDHAKEHKGVKNGQSLRLSEFPNLQL